MLAYVDLIQRKEKEIGCDVLTHQKWYVNVRRFQMRPSFELYVYRSGANYIDKILSTVSSGSSSTSAVGKDSTEHSF
jgi:isocitrate lyase